MILPLDALDDITQGYNVPVVAEFASHVLVTLRLVGERGARRATMTRPNATSEPVLL
jgi:hypothetical protein